MSKEKFTKFDAPAHHRATLSADGEFRVYKEVVQPDGEILPVLIGPDSIARRVITLAAKAACTYLVYSNHPLHWVCNSAKTHNPVSSRSMSLGITRGKSPLEELRELQARQMVAQQLNDDLLYQESDAESLDFTVQDSEPVSPYQIDRVVRQTVYSKDQIGKESKNDSKMEESKDTPQPNSETK